MANNVIVGAPLSATGAVRIAPLGSAVPTGAATPLDSAYLSPGLIGEDGLSETTDRSTEVVRAWGGDEVRRIQTDFGLSYSFSFLETNPDVLRQIHGAGNVTGTDGELAITVNKGELPHQVFVFEVKDGENKIRIVLPNAQITEIGDANYSHASAVSYEVTVTAFPDENGNQGYKYLAGPAAAESAPVGV